MAVKLPAKIERNNVSDTYAMLEDLLIQGGLKIVPDIAARDALPAEVRKEGMPVIVLVDGQGERSAFHLSGGITNTDWANGLGVEAESVIPNINQVMNAGSTYTGNLLKLGAGGGYFGSGEIYMIGPDMISTNSGSSVYAFLIGRSNNAVGHTNVYLFGRGLEAGANNIAGCGIDATNDGADSVSVLRLAGNRATNSVAIGQSSNRNSSISSSAWNKVVVIGSGSNILNETKVDGNLVQDDDIVVTQASGLKPTPASVQGLIIRGGRILPSALDGDKPTANRTINRGDWKRGYINVGAQPVILTIDGLTSPENWERLELNLMNASGSLTLDASAVSIVDSTATDVSPSGAISINSAVLLYDSGENTYKIIGDYSA